MLTAIFCATTWEAEHALKNKNYGYKKICETPFEVWRNGSRLVFITGIGLVNSALCFSWAARKYKFDEALNIGAAGATILPPEKKSRAVSMGKLYKISDVVCMEPYNGFKYKMAKSGKRLVTGSRPMSTAEERIFAGRYGELVDMEGYALARCAETFGKKISMLKLVTDFSPECDIHANILSLSEKFANLDDVWVSI